MPTTRDEAITQTYAEMRLLVFKVTHAFALRFNIPFEDLISEAHIQFIKAYDSFDKTKGMRLSSWVYHEVWTGLMSFMRKELRHRGLEEFTELTPMEHTHQNNFLVELQSELSRDARAVVRILLGGGKDFTVLCQWNRVGTRTAAVKALREHLQDKGWSVHAIERGIEEIRAVVNDRAPRLSDPTAVDAFYDERNTRQWSSRDECWLLDRIGLSPARVQALLA